ncbi:outer membrane beta-barrel protein [Ferruginibacter sp. HRS2-29]|uniref:outer membrane beta-barrel protein n=1 Tax=Ferruginibacter sp. HRS2-29 TaxID=2487334 RepID=UPI0020CD3E0C|nr:outer membrane beta-barrel protein [Ferruginibacter sp. HRS2-29]MCP9751597.1 hypothetical protein [Ferruginibacter sp. HRS2-29]
MSRYLHNDPGQNISASEAWQDMRLLLDKHLPVTPAPAKRRPFLFYSAAASFIGLLLLCYLQLQPDHGKMTSISGKKNTTDNFSANADSTTVPAIAGTSLVTTFSPTVISPAVFDNGRPKGQQQATIRYMSGEKIKNIYSATTAYHTTTTTSDDQNDDEITRGQKSVREKQLSAMHNMELIADKGFTLPAGLHMYSGKTDMIYLLPVKEKADPSDKKRRKGWWETGAGIGSNAVIDNEVDPRPYPVAEVKYNFSPKIYVSAGLTAFSPVNSHSRSINKTVYVNDTANNLRSYNEVLRYTRFEYADIPIMVGFRINKRFAVQAGLQASVLTGQKKRRDLKGYDFQMNPLSTGPNVITLSPVSSDVFEAKARKIDGRAIGGINYTAKQFSVNLSYQQALQAAVQGSHVSSSKNRLVSLQLLYRLKK